MSFLSALVALGFLIAKLVFWNSLQLGTALMLMGIFFFGAIGEYIGSIHTQVRNMPLVIEQERINFD